MEDLKRQDYISLLEHNSQKMNFQQSMCFQLQNWALIITLGVLTIVWNLYEENASDHKTFVAILVLHIGLIITLLFLYKRDRDWFRYFIVFRERVKLLEEIVISNKSEASFEEEYYKILKEKEEALDLKEEKYKKEKKGNWKYFFMLMLLDIISLSSVFLC
jgi:Na+/melibiose symporter-like transporter